MPRYSLFSLLLAASACQISHAQDLMATYQLAIENDPDLKSVQFSRSATEEIKSQSIAQMLPQVTFSAGSNRIRSETTSFLGPLLQHYWDHKLGFNLVQPVFHWDHWVQLDQSENKIAQAEAKLQAKQQELMRRTAEAYFNVLAAQDSLSFTSAEKRSIEKQLEQAKQRFEVGIIPMTDVYEAQAGFDRATAAEISAHNQVDNAKEALREIIGIEGDNLNSLQAEIPLSPPSPAELSAWSDAAEFSNFSLVAQLNQAEVARKNIELQQAKHLPTVDVVAQYSEQDASGSQYGSLGNTEAIGLQLNLPLYEGGGTSSRVRQAEFEYQASKEDLTKLKRSVIRSVKDAFRGVVSSISEVKALDVSTQSSEKALEAAEAGFEVGTQTMVDVLAVQRNLYKSKSDYAQSRYKYLVNGIKLKEAAGNLSEADLQQINQYLQTHPTNQAHQSNSTALPTK